MKTSKRLEGIGEYYFSQKLREIDELSKMGKQVINLGIGNPDMPPHADVLAVLRDECLKPSVHGYQSYKGSLILRQAMSDWYKRCYGVALDPATEILPLIGSKEGIMHICMTYLDKGDEVLVPDPGYPTYTSAAKLAGGKAVSYSLKAKNNYAPDFDRLSKKSLKKVKLMFVNYPQMPTGQLPDMDLFRRIVAFGREHNILIIHDNPYSFILNENPMSLLQVDDARECVLELNSLSKSHNMAGWRVGMLCGAQKKIDEVLRFKSNMDSGMFLPVQLAAAKALTLGKDWHDELNKVYSERRERVFDLLDVLGCTFDRQQAGLFVWARVPGNVKDGYHLSDDVLYNAGVFITPGGIFGKGGEKYVRVSLCSPVETLQAAMEKVTRLESVKASS